MDGQIIRINKGVTNYLGLQKTIEKSSNKFWNFT